MLKLIIHLVRLVWDLFAQCYIDTCMGKVIQAVQKLHCTRCYKDSAAPSAQE